MAYSIEIAKVLAKTLQRFSTLNPHQLAGHVANLEFWLQEVRHSTSVIDGCRKRFDSLKVAQAKEATKRGTITYVDSEHTLEVHSPPRPVPDTELKAARAEVIDSAYKFLVRCYKSDLMDEQSLRNAVESIGSSVDPSDIAK